MPCGVKPGIDSEMYVCTGHTRKSAFAKEKPEGDRQEAANVGTTLSWLLSSVVTPYTLPCLHPRVAKRGQKPAVQFFKVIVMTKRVTNCSFYVFPTVSQ